MFQNSALKRVKLPSTLKRIECRTFAGCKNLKTVELPNGLEYIGKECFYESGLESVRIPSALKTIEGWTFFNCKNLKHVEFPEGLEKIDAAAFSGSGIERVDLPSSTRRIGAEAFMECKRLRDVRLNEGLETLGEVERFEGWKRNGNVFSRSALESVVIPSTLEVLEKDTFFGC